MSGMQWHLAIEFEDGNETRVIADQRDAAAWEMQDFGCPIDQVRSRPVLFMRWIGWHALSRKKAISMTWKKFSDECVSVDNAPDNDPENDVVNPGKPDRSAANSST